MSTDPLMAADLRIRGNDWNPSVQAKMGSTQKKLIIVIIVGIIAIIVGAVIGAIWAPIFNSMMHEQLELTTTSESYKMWEKTPIPMYLQLYLFNWTNPHDFNSAVKTKPHFVQMGPYTFREIVYKVNEQWNENGTITFQQKRSFHFEESLSNGSLSDNVTNLNVIVSTFAYTIRHQKPFVRSVLDKVMTSLGERLVITKTVRELLFDGYDDKLLRIAAKLNMTGIPMKKFGWFYARNESETYDGTFNMLTGKDNVFSLGMIKEWNYSNQSKSYDGSCGAITGTTGDLWPPLKNNESVSIFASDLCSSLSLTYENDTEYLGLTGKRFVSDKYMFDNGTNVPSLSCYCHNTECVPNGVRNVSLCKFGAPAFVSLPHFYLADESYKNAVSGLSPDTDKYEFAIVVEPSTGIPMEIQAQLQINLLVQPDSAMSLFKNIPRTFVPMLWFTQEAKLTEELAEKVKFLLIIPMLGQVTFFGIAGIGLLLVFIGLTICINRRCRNKESQRLLSNKGSNNTINSDG
ncbi:protein croquemort isoform X2 [Orussus abietinus]|uniref:protein croquemort isoform X2 n=1 Tax=Orussus abietinus TaxID=222816 RepID=UPI0006262DD5|nr:protein croquemort isoform X2 [Orussus abietinus]XP_012270484.1 protein croquemort isoform X2 [Orussus abietinus]XP_012270485.1 protein croquemort isoform X2 [Orussus abietinus]